MTFVYENGDINVTLVTLICIGSIVGFLILVSIFTRLGKKEQEELEEYYDEDNYVQPTPKVKAKRKSKVSKPKATVKSVPKPKQKYKTPVVKKTTTKKKTVNKPKVITKTKSNTKPNTNKKKTTVKQVVHKAAVSKLAPKKKVVKKSLVTKPVAKKPTTEKVTELPAPEKPINTTTQTATPDNNKANQTSVKITKVGNVQVDDSIQLNDVEKKMLSGMLTSSGRGHIIQLVNGSKIMDFPIDSLTQLNHIEKQIVKFSKVTGSYIVYVIWESNLKYRTKLGQKLRYNPNVRYK